MNFYKIIKYGKTYILPPTTTFCVSKEGISVLNTNYGLFELKPKDIKPYGVELIAVLNELGREYRRYLPKFVKEKKVEEPVLIGDNERLTCPRCGNEDTCVDMGQGEFHYEFSCRECGCKVSIRSEEEDKILKVKADGELLHKYGPN